MKFARIWRALVLVVAAAVPLVAFADARSHKDSVAAKRRLIGKNATAEFLKLPSVAGLLGRMPAPDAKRLRESLFVSSEVNVNGGYLAVHGNAPHLGGIQMAAICARIEGDDVFAVVYIDGGFVVYAKKGEYLGLPDCVRDWIARVKSPYVATAPEGLRYSIPRE